MERVLYPKFAKLLKRLDPKAFYYKIPDTGGTGGRRPFDAFAVIRGVPWAIEFKSKGGVVTELQDYNLKRFKEADGKFIVIYPYTLNSQLVLYMIDKSKLERRENEKQKGN